MLWSGLSQFFLWSPVSPVSLSGLWGLFQRHQLQLVSLSLSYATVFSALWQGRGIFVLFSFIFTLWSDGMVKSIRWQFFFFLSINTPSGLQNRIGGFICILKSQRIFSFSFSRSNSDLWIYHLSTWSNFNLLHNSQWITFPTQQCLTMYSFCSRLLYSFIIWLTISSL